MIALEKFVKMYERTFRVRSGNMISVFMVGSFWLNHRSDYINMSLLNPEEEPYRPQFEIPIKDGTVTVELQTDKAFMSISHKFTCSEEDFNLMKDQIILHKKEQMESAGRKLLSTIKYGLNLSLLDDNIVSRNGSFKFEYTTDYNHWDTVNNTTKTIRSHTHYFLNSMENQVRTYLKNDFEPFIALKHLHRAKNDDDARFKWIDATIAAELAIKEFFVRKHPMLKTMLLELPSPPLKKLYKNLLLVYAGEESPLPSRFFDDASRIRNELVHRPQDVLITIEQAEEYVAGVEKAIYHLLSLLYPEDSTIQGIYRSTNLRSINFDDL